MSAQEQEPLPILDATPKKLTELHSSYETILDRAVVPIYERYIKYNREIHDGEICRKR